MTEYRLISDPRSDLDVEAAIEWYENEQPRLGFEFLNELRAAYNSIADGPGRQRSPTCSDATHEVAKRQERNSA